MKISLLTKILIGMIVGIIIGVLAGEQAAIIKPVGDLFLRLIRMVVVPLVFASLLVGTASLGDPKKLGRIGMKTIGFYLVTTAIAISIGLFIANTVRPGAGFDPAVEQTLLEEFGEGAVGAEESMRDSPSTVDALLVRFGALCDRRCIDVGDAGRQAEPFDERIVALALCGALP